MKKAIEGQQIENYVKMGIYLYNKDKMTLLSLFVV